MSFNASKTKVMFFSLKNTINLPIITFQNCELEFVDSHKHLGLNFSCDAKWSDHIDKIVTVAQKKVGSIEKVKIFCK